MKNTTQILKLQCSHDYFSGIIEGLQLQPTAATKQWAHAHRIVMRTAATDITLYTTIETPENYKESLTFLLLVNDTEFYNYTFLPDIATKDQLCYLTNTNEKLTTKTAITEVDFLKKIYGISLPEENIEEEKSLSITNHEGKVVLETLWNGRISIASLLYDLPVGKYNWTYGDNQGYFFGNPEIVNKAFGLVEIDLKTIENTEYEIHFNTRASIWEYYIIDKQQTGNNYEIVDEKQFYQFGVAEQTKVLGGKLAVKIVSEEAIPFKQHPEYQFKLITKTNSGAMMQPWNTSLLLPTAKSEQLQVLKEQQLKYITPIYIYI